MLLKTEPYHSNTRAWLSILQLMLSVLLYLFLLREVTWLEVIPGTFSGVVFFVGSSCNEITQEIHRCHCGAIR